MITSGIAAQTSTYEVTLAITGAPQVDAGFGPREELFTVTGAHIAYCGTDITAIAILTTTDELAVDIDEPERLEPWLRDLVEQHRPAAVTTR